MARYTIDFSTNASAIVREIEKVNAAIAKTVRTGKTVSIDIDASQLSQGINASFKQLDKEIAKYQRRLRKLQIGSPEFTGLAGDIGAQEGIRERGRMKAQAAGLRQQAFAFEPGSAVALTKALQAAKIEASQIKPSTEEWMELQKRIGALKLDLQKADQLAENVQMQQNLGAFSPGSLNALEAKLTILRNRAKEISPSTTEWKQLNKEIVQTEQAIERQTRRPLTRGQRLGAAGGAFLYGGGLGGGVGSAVGGIAGGLAGGVPGAFTGAAIGQAADNLQAMTAGMIEQAVTIEKLQMGLAAASNDFSDFARATQEVEQIASRLLIPLDQAYRKFTQLRASTVALGYDTETTGKIFEGTASAVLRAGGSMDDVDGAMRAVVQVFSKGKLTAEELRGQLAERLPGAVVEFAQSSGMSVQQLDKAFEAGQTSIDDFVVFLRKKAKDSESFTNEMATSSEYAGARMAKAFEKLRINIGKSFQPMGAAIQDFTTRSINGIDRLIQKLIELQIIKPGADFFVGQALAGEKGGVAGLEQQLLEAGAKEQRARQTAQAGGLGFIANLLPDVKEASQEVKILEEALKKIRKLQGITKPRQPPQSTPEETEDRSKKFLDAIEKREESIANARKQREEEIANIRENALKQIEAIERRYRDEKLRSERELGRVQREIAASAEERSLLEREARSALTGEDPALIEQERQLGEAIRRYTEEKVSIEEQEQDRRLAKDRELEDFKKNNADAINKANEKYAKQIGEIQRAYAKTVAKLIEDGTGNGAKRLAKAGQLMASIISQASAQSNFQRLSGLPIRPARGGVNVAGQIYTDKEAFGAELTQSALGSNLAPADIQSLIVTGKNYFDAVIEGQRLTAEFGRLLEQSAQAATVALPTVDLGDLEARFKAAQSPADGVAASVRDAREELNKQENLLTALQSTLTEIGASKNKELRDLIEQDNLIAAQIDLINKGMLPAMAEQEASNNRQFEQAMARAKAAASQAAAATKDKQVHAEIERLLQNQLNTLEAMSKEYNTQSQTLRDRAAILDASTIQAEAGMTGRGLGAGFINEAATAFEGQLLKGVSPEAAALVAKATEQLTIAKTAADALQSSINGIGTAFGTAMTTGVANLVAGTTTAKEVFAEFLRSIGQALLSAAGQMIATYTAIGIAKIFAGMGGGGGGLEPKTAAGNAAFMQRTGALGFANGGIALGGFQAFANGGIVKGPTLGLVGEGRYNEAVVPLPDGKSIPVQLGGRTARDLMGGNAPGMPQQTSLNMSFETTKINGVEYVSRDQLEQAMAETRRASISGGARQGMAMTLDKIRQSPSTRSRIGMR